MGQALERRQDVVLACVGNRDPRQENGRDGPILSYLAARDRDGRPRPLRVVLLFTPPGANVDPGTETDERARELHTILTAAYSGLKVFLWSFGDSDPAAFERVFARTRDAYVEQVRECRQSFKELPPFTLFASPGTPQMKAAWYVLARTVLPRPVLHEYRERTQRIDETRLDPLEVLGLRQAAVGAIERRQFAEAGELLGSLSESSAVAGSAHEIVFSLAAALQGAQAWANRDLAGAERSLADAVAWLGGSPLADEQARDVLGGALGAQRDHVSAERRIRGRERETYAVADTIVLAEAAHHQGRTVEALALLWESLDTCLPRLIEQFVRVQPWGGKVDVNCFLLDDRTPAKIARGAGFALRRRLRDLSPKELCDLLRALEHPLHPEIDRLRDRRNAAVHELDAAVDPGFVDASIRLVRQVYVETSGPLGRRLMESHPFAAAAFKRLAGALSSALYVSS